ncbi:MAG: CaiB/BaiF CoA transferase family protein [Jiangellaceae bacterium]
MAGPLAGVRIIELGGIGAGPFCGMVLADMGAQVIRCERPAAAASDAPADLLLRGRRSLAVDLKHPDGAAVVLDLIAGSDAVIEGFRPGVAERLGLGPDDCLARNPKLVYGRMTGWGQDGPLAGTAGHDINYIALAGALHSIGRRDGPPVPPLNLVGDFGGGGMLLALGLVGGLFEAQRSGVGQVVDAAMVDGAALLMTMFHSLRAAGLWSDERGTNLLDTGAPFYDVYECADGEHVSIGSLEPQFYAELLARLDLDGSEADSDLRQRMDRARWPAIRERLAAVFLTRTRAEWTELLEGTDVCFAPVLSLAEAPRHPHLVARGTFVEMDGVPQPAPAPRFSRTPSAMAGPAVRPGADTDAVLAELGLDADRVAKLRDAGVVS